MRQYFPPLGTLLVLLLLSPPLPALAHAFLTVASPRVGATIAAAPPQLQLTFTEGVEPAFSSVTVRNAAGIVVSLGHCKTAGAANRLSVGLQKLPPGPYRVTWHAVATDLHKTQGSFVFHVGK